MALNLDELDLIDTEKEEFKKLESKEPSIDFKLPKLQSGNYKSPYDQAKEFSEKEQLSPALAFIESYKPVRNEEKEARLKKTAAVNSIGQALTNVIDAYYGKKGAYIPIRNNSISGILNTLSQEEGQYQQGMDKYNNLKLAQMIRDINLDQEEQKDKDRIARENALLGAKNKREDEKDAAAIKQREKERKENFENQKKLLGLKADDKESTGKPFFQVKGSPDPNTRVAKTYGMDQATFFDVATKVAKMEGGAGETASLLASIGKGGDDYNTIVKLQNKVAANWNKFYGINENGEYYLKDNAAPTTQGYEDVYTKPNNVDPLDLGITKKEDDPLGLF